MDAVTRFAVTPEERAALKLAIASAIDQCGGVTAAAMHTRADKSVLSRAQNDQDALTPSLNDCLTIDRASGTHFILAAYAKALGCKVVPQKERHRMLSLTREAGLAAKEAGEAVHSITEAEADGVMSPTEAKLVDREIVEAITQFTKVHEGLIPRLVKS